MDPTISNGDASKNLNHSPVENLMEGNGQPTTQQEQQNKAMREREVMITS